MEEILHLLDAADALGPQTRDRLGQTSLRATERLSHMPFMTALGVIRGESSAVDKFYAFDYINQHLFDYAYFPQAIEIELANNIIILPETAHNVCQLFEGSGGDGSDSGSEGAAGTERTYHEPTDADLVFLQRIHGQRYFARNPDIYRTVTSPYKLQIIEADSELTVYDDVDAVWIKQRPNLKITIPAHIRALYVEKIEDRCKITYLGRVETLRIDDVRLLYSQFHSANEIHIFVPTDLYTMTSKMLELERYASTKLLINCEETRILPDQFLANAQLLSVTLVNTMNIIAIGQRSFFGAVIGSLHCGSMMQWKGCCASVFAQSNIGTIDLCVAPSLSYIGASFMQNATIGSFDVNVLRNAKIIERGFLGGTCTVSKDLSQFTNLN